MSKLCRRIYKTPLVFGCVIECKNREPNRIYGMDMRFPHLVVNLAFKHFR